MTHKHITPHTLSTTNLNIHKNTFTPFTNLFKLHNIHPTSQPTLEPQTKHTTQLYHTHNSTNPISQHPHALSTCHSLLYTHEPTLPSTTYNYNTHTPQPHHSKHRKYKVTQSPLLHKKNRTPNTISTQHNLPYNKYKTSHPMHKLDLKPTNNPPYNT